MTGAGAGHGNVMVPGSALSYDASMFKKPWVQFWLVLLVEVVGAGGLGR